MKQLQDKIAVITGAGSGIGRALALQLSDEGCWLAISDINGVTLGETETMLKKKGAVVYSEILDVSDRQSMEAYPEKVIQYLGGVDIVINNAGVAVVSTVEEHSIDDYEWLMGINFWGVLYGSKFFIPYLRKEHKTFIVNISSIFGLVSMPNLSSYSAAKFAVSGFSESLRHELSNSGIHVMTVFPGGVRTDFAKKARFKSTPAKKSHAQFNQIFEKYSMSTTDSTAKAIIRGIQKEKKRVLVGPDAVLGDLLKRMMPVRYDWMVRLISLFV